MRISTHLGRHTRGDTIVEVLIVLAVLGGALGFAYQIANTSLQQSQDAEEHTEVVKILQGQLENLRQAVAGQGQTYAGIDNFCYYTQVQTANDGSQYTTTTTVPVPHPNDMNSFPAQCTQGYYHYYITVPPAGSSTYTATGKWDNVFGNGQASEILFYRIYPQS